MERAEARSRLLSVVAVLPALLALQACYEESEPVATAATKVTDQAGEAVTGDWLDPGSPEEPAAWLARLSGEDIERLAPLLTRAQTQWREDRRMLANRFVGLWRDNQLSQPLARLIEDFLAVPPKSEGTLSALTQSYRVLRDQGADHPTAINRLSGGAHD